MRQGARPASARDAAATGRTRQARTPGRATAVSRSTGTLERTRAPRPPRRVPAPANPVRRQRWLTVLAAVVVTIFVGRLVQVQVFEAPGLAAQARDGRMTTVNVPAHRGDITDRNGVVLATSVDRYTISADPWAIQKFRGGSRTDAAGSPVADGALGVAQLLAPVLGRDRAELAAQINGDSRYVVLARNVEPDKQREISALRLAAVIRTELVSQRVYPQKTIAGPLLGFVDADQVGQGGLERAFDDLLAGQAGSETFERSLDGVRIPGGQSMSTPAVPGGDVQLTIDSEVQWKAQSSLDDMVRRSGAAFGIALVVDLQTGEMLAIADSGSVDPNDRSNADVARGSRAVQDIFDPGSTAKVITMAAALETGAWAVDSQFTVPFRFTTPNGQSFRDSHDHPTWNLTLAGILARSSNTGTVQVAEKIPPQVQYDFMHKFGFGQPTGLNLPGESNGILHPVDRWDGRTRYAVTFGQGVSVNAVQALDVFSTVGNGGVNVPPVLVKGTRVPGGELVPTARAAGTRVISAETSTTLLHMMEEVTGEDGTAASAQIPGYRVAGKTGTAQIIMPGKATTYMSSFVGVAPADAPRFAVGVFLKSPRTSIYGGVVAAPVFRDVMSFVLQKEGVPPSAPAPDPLPLTW
ncbi:penicillin-binding protein 2 [Xylanimonas protaetiae]|uniref:Penicillin-binding protein 2 n=1 Tax=Xylanimonas protaetiae TaxID=2509457 RepID=A0A4V0YGN8_9MICO|nr:penicillin-binding protein 2 [Xylanimonas protaetiae]